MFSTRHTAGTTAHALRQILDFPGWDGEGGGEPPVLDDATKKLVADSVNAGVAAAVANLRKSDLPKLVGDSVKAELTPFTERFTSLDTALKTLAESHANNGGGNSSGGGNANDGKGKDLPPEVNARLKTLDENAKTMANTIAQLQKDKSEAEQKAEKSDRHAKIRVALNEIQFADGKAAETAFLIVEPSVKRTDDGGLVGGENLPVDAFVRDEIQNNHKYLLRTTGTFGSGAAGGAAGAGPRTGGRGDTSEIKVGMPADRRSAVVENIREVLAQASR